jgi:hypothetical protein
MDGNMRQNISRFHVFFLVPLDSLLRSPRHHQASPTDHHFVTLHCLDEVTNLEKVYY